MAQGLVSIPFSDYEQVYVPVNQAVPDYFVRPEVYLLIFIILKLVATRNTVFVLLVHLVSSIYLLCGEWKRMVIIQGTYPYSLVDEGKQETYLLLSIAVWVASVVFDIYKMRPLLKDFFRVNPRNCSLVCTAFTAICILNSLGLLCYVSTKEWQFNNRLNRDIFLGIFFIWAVGMKFMRTLWQGYCFCISTRPGDHCKVLKLMGWEDITWTGFSNIIVLIENYFLINMFAIQSIGVIAFIVDSLYHLWMFLWFCQIDFQFGKRATSIKIRLRCLLRNKSQTLHDIENQTLLSRKDGQEPTTKYSSQEDGDKVSQEEEKSRSSSELVCINITISHPSSPNASMELLDKRVQYEQQHRPLLKDTITFFYGQYP